MRRHAVAAVAVLALTFAAPAASAQFGMPDALTPRGEELEGIFNAIMIAGILVFLLVFALLAYVLWRYREGSGHGRTTHEKHRGSVKAELIWTIGPLAVMLWIGVMSYAGLVRLDEGIGSDDYEMEVRITGFQWAWQMEYGDNVTVFVNPSADADTGEMSYSDTFHLPADTRILLNLTGGDVIHALNIMDENRAFVTMDDANPYGPHKYHRQVISFPAGKYLIQCKEMCLNPGHGYMRAEIIVEERADFDRWFEERALGAGAELLQRFDLTADGDSLDTAANTTIVKGTRVLMDIDNKGSSPLTVTSPGGARNVTIPAGGSGLLAFDTAVTGDFTVTASNGGRIAFRSIEATAIRVDLGAFELLPETIDVVAGTTYLVQTTNVHSTTHNLYFGSYRDDIVAQSATIGPGASASFVWTPTESGTIDMWCDVPGHYDLGMHGDVHVE